MEASKPEGRRLILDTDCGGDDAWVLFQLIVAEVKLNIKIIAITCVQGNTSLENVVRNVLRILEILKRTDIPVYAGAARPIINKPNDEFLFYGTDGLCDLQHDTEPDVGQLKSETMVEAMHKIVLNNPSEVDLVCIGPLTNAALAIRVYPDIADKFNHVYIMGGNSNAVGNITSNAEFNFYIDPEAARIVLTSLQCPVTILPWEPFLEDNLKIPVEWRFDILGNSNTKMMTLLNKIDQYCYKDIKYWMPCDLALAVLYLFPQELVTRSRKCNVTVELSGTLTRGQMVIDHLERSVPNATVVELIDQDFFIKQLLWTVQTDLQLNC